MMEKDEQKLTLYRPATYQIKVPGHLDESWSDWVGRMTITVESESDGPPITTLTGTVDQAALQGLLRRLYLLGLPLISVVCVDCGLKDDREMPPKARQETSSPAETSKSPGSD